MKKIGHLREKGRLGIRAANLLFPDTAKVVGKVQDTYTLRSMMEEVKAMNKWDLVGAEIGVDQGRHASRILEVLPIKMLYLVDPYEYIHLAGYSDDQHRKHGAERQKDARYLLKPHQNIKWVIRSSNTAMQHVPSDLDFVYIDGDHSYNAVLEDCENWYPKVKIGGILGGHDYISSRPKVKRAVIDFCKTYKLKYHNKPNDWWIVKEKEI